MKKSLAYTAAALLLAWGRRPMPRVVAAVAVEEPEEAQLEGRPGARVPEWAARLAAR